MGAAFDGRPQSCIVRVRRRWPQLRIFRFARVYLSVVSMVLSYIHVQPSGRATNKSDGQCGGPEIVANWRASFVFA